MQEFPEDCRRFSPRSLGVGPFETSLIRELKSDSSPFRATLLEGPPGCGKSFVLQALYRHALAQGIPAVWISLDDVDIDLERFQALLVRACLQAIPGNTNMSWEVAGENVGTGRLVASLAATWSGHLEIFIDNLEYCRDPKLRKTLDQMFSLWPCGKHLWMATSHHFKVDYTRYVTEGILRYLQMPDLCFTREDTERFLTERCGRRLSTSDLHLVYDRTRGWPLAVSFFASIVEKEEKYPDLISRFSGADIGISSFLKSQLLYKFDDCLLKFLYQIVNLPEINYELCLYATEEPCTSKYIDSLLDENCFLRLLDRNCQRMEFLPFVRESFINESRKNLDAADLRVVLERATEWFRRRKETALAVECALTAQSAELIATLLHEIAPAWVGQNGGLLTYIKWVERARTMGAVLSLDSEYWYLWALLYSRQHQVASERSKLLWQRSEAEQSLNSCAERRLAFQRRFEELRILIAFFQDQTALAGREALKWLGDSAALGQDHISMATVACCVAINASINFDFTTARDAMRTAQTGIVLANSEYGAAWVAVLSAQIDFFEGDYRQCHDALKNALARATHNLGQDVVIISTMQLLMARCLLEMGLCDEAQGYLLPGLEQIPLHGISEITFCGIEAAIEMWDGAEEQGPLSPLTIGQLIESYPPPMDIIFRCLLVRRFLRMGRIEEAVLQGKSAGLDLDANVDSITAPSVFVRELIQITQLEYLFCRGKNRQALALAETLLETVKANKRRGRIVELEIIMAILAFRADDRNQALRHLHRAIRLAAKPRIVYPFLVRIEMIRTMISHSTEKEWGFVDHEERYLFQQLRGAAMQAVPEASALQVVDPEESVVGCLTARELELLRLVDAGLSNRQIGERINITLTTVKWHLSNIYVKLNVRSRTAATASARTMNLLANP